MRPTPALEALAAEGTTFANAYSPAPWTGQAVPSTSDDRTAALDARHKSCLEQIALDPDLAFDYFNRATRAPLAFQPHSLELTTRFLAESYRNLGLMYQAGLGFRPKYRMYSR